MPTHRDIPEQLMQIFPLADHAASGERSDAAANRARIIEAARRLFLDGGSEGVSMDAVAEAAGVGKGTVFRRFGDRAGLMEALLDEEMRVFQDEFLRGPAPLGPGGDPVRRLEAFMDQLLVVLERNLGLVVGAGLALTHPPRLFDALALHLRVLLAEISPDRNPEIVAELLLSALSGPMLRRLTCDRQNDLSEVQAAVHELLHGIIPPPR